MAQFVKDNCQQINSIQGIGGDGHEADGVKFLIHFRRGVNKPTGTRGVNVKQNCSGQKFTELIATQFGDLDRDPGKFVDKFGVDTCHQQLD